MKSHQLLRELGPALGQPRLRLDLEPSCVVTIGKKLHLELSYSSIEDSLYICASLGLFHGDQRAKLFRVVLDANLDTGRLGGAHFSLDAPENEILLCRTFSAQGQTPSSVMNEVSRFSGAWHAWRGQLREKLLISA